MEEKIHYKYPKIYNLGGDENKDLLLFEDDILVVEEKVDGGNFSFFINNKTNDIFECSKNRNLITDNDEKTFIKQRIWLREKLKGKKLNLDYIYFCEIMAQHTIKYTEIPDVIGFDIRPKHCANAEGCGMFLSREARENEFDRLGIENVPLIWKGTVREFKKKDINEFIPKSKYYDGLVEGIVIKNQSRKANNGNHQIYGKFVREEFKEVNKAVFGSIKDKNSDTSKIVQEFITDARIKKIINKLINEENMKLEMSLMKFVPTAVIKDVLKEEFNNIFNNYKFMDFKEMKQKGSKRCLSVLKEMMMINSGMG